MTNADGSRGRTLVEWLVLCEREIQRQAEGVLARMVGTGGEAKLDYAGMWEDRHGQLPPRIQARWLHRASGDRGCEYGLDLIFPVGAFHDATKAECLFELCMLRAEARQELEGRGDGHVVGRLEGLFDMIKSGRLEFND